ncbi:probable methyltransferase PMT24, partial [Tanacetum coccineum]
MKNTYLHKKHTHPSLSSLSNLSSSATKPSFPPNPPNPYSTGVCFRKPKEKGLICSIKVFWPKVRDFGDGKNWDIEFFHSRVEKEYWLQISCCRLQIGIRWKLLAFVLLPPLVDGIQLNKIDMLLASDGFSKNSLFIQEHDDITAMPKLTMAICWEQMVIYKDRLNQIGATIYKKPTSNECCENRQENDPPLCENVNYPYNTRSG